MANYAGVSQALRDYSQTYKGGLDEAVASQERSANLLYQGGMDILNLIEKQRKNQFEMQKYQEDQAYRKSAAGRADEALALQKEEFEMTKYTNALDNLRKLKIAEDKGRDKDLYANYGGAIKTQQAFLDLTKQHQRSKDAGASPDELMKDYRSLYHFDPRFILDEKTNVPRRTLKQWMAAHRNPNAPLEWINKYDKPFEALLTDVKYGMLSPEMLEATKVNQEEVAPNPKKVESFIEELKKTIPEKDAKALTKEEINAKIKKEEEDKIIESETPGKGLDGQLLDKIKKAKKIITEVVTPKKAYASVSKTEDPIVIGELKSSGALVEDPPEDEEPGFVSDEAEPFEEELLEDNITVSSTPGLFGVQELPPDTENISPAEMRNLQIEDISAPRGTEITTQDLLKNSVPPEKKEALLNNAIEIVKNAPDTALGFIKNFPEKLKKFIDPSHRGDAKKMGDLAFNQLKEDMPWIETSSYDTQKFIALMAFQSSGLPDDKVENVKRFRKMIRHLKTGDKEKAWAEFASSPMFARIYGSGKEDNQNERINILREMSSVLETPGKIYKNAQQKGFDKPYVAKLRRDDIKKIAGKNQYNKILY